MSRPKEEQPITAEQLQQNGVVEDLVRTNRVPWLVRDAEGKVVFCFIPPVGTKKDDSIEGVPGFGYIVYSPTGELRGTASYLVLNDEAANNLVKRRNFALEELKGENK
jgi:hypothetical protein